MLSKNLNFILMFFFIITLFTVPAYAGDPLSNAVDSGDIELVKELLGSGIPINYNDNSYPLYRSVLNKDMAMTKFLLQSGVNPNHSNSYYHPVIKAANIGATDIGMMILETGKIDPNLPMDGKSKDLLANVITFSNNHKIAMKLLDMGAKPVDIVFHNPSGYATVRQFDSILGAIKKDDTLMLRLLLAYGKSAVANAWCCDTGDANTRSACHERTVYGQSPIFFMALRKFSSTKLVQDYIDAGFNVNAIDNVTGNNAIHVILSTGRGSDEDMESIKLLVKAGTNIKAKNKQNITPLLLAMTNDNLSGNKKVKEFLKSLGG